MGPILVEQYVFSRLHVDADLAHNPEIAVPTVNVRVKMGIGPTPEEENKYQIHLELVNLHPTDGREGTLPYHIEFSMIGHFVAAPGTDQELVRINGASILYSAAREMILQITGRGPWGPYMLPTVNLKNMQKQPQAVEVDVSNKAAT